MKISGSGGGGGASIQAWVTDLKIKPDNMYLYLNNLYKAITEHTAGVSFIPGNFQLIGGMIGSFIFKGDINSNDDFPTVANANIGWIYKITANVTDNDITKTNTGLAFKLGDEIAWDGSTWITLGPILNWSAIIDKPTTFTPATHNHNDTYSILAHNHDGSYSALGHDHSGVYSVSGHDHSGVYAIVAHNHDGSYSALGHDHSGVYATSGHNHSGVYSEPGHSHAGTAVSLSVTNFGKVLSSNETNTQLAFDKLDDHEHLSNVLPAVNGTTNVTIASDMVVVDATAGVATINLYAATGNTGKTVAVRKTDVTTNAVNIVPSGAEKINGASSIPLTLTNQIITLKSDGANWVVVAEAAYTGYARIKVGTVAPADTTMLWIDTN